MKKLSVLMLIGALTVGTLAMTGCGGADNTADVYKRQGCDKKK